MAENDQEKTEQPTGLRLADARAKGQVAYSHEVTAAVVLLASFATLQMAGGDLMHVLARAMSEMFELPVHFFFDRPRDLSRLLGTGARVALAIAPFFGIAVVLALLSGFLQVGFNISTEAITLDLTKLNPMANFGKLCSPQSLVKIGTSLLKMAIVAVISYAALKPHAPELAQAQDRPVLQSLDLVVSLMLTIGVRVGGALLALSVLDVLYRKWKHVRDLRMTKEEVKEEGKKTEGDPKIKAKIREAQRAMVLQRMRTDVKRADVVIRNPTHYAIALKYDQTKDSAPKVVAKGRDYMALQIIKIAEEAKVEVVENRPLARELYRSVDLGDVVPERLFRAVAQVLAFVFRKKKKSKQRAAAASAGAQPATSQA
jgi:flagellar biosynthesis protein FlhB